ncbi:nuclear transport factor 2 family protein [Roseovarius aestuariivivens]|uniref:nuclear transport factor 2 family protein n=1 Tax=Roseovarius aestuariivivens TaxID=1888910 RepID=UPI0010822C4C|nr:nuclear transport factor 2 family protein [Roseovarius aestuariivivens]
MSASPDDLHAVADLAKAYGEAVYYARADVFEDLCHDRFQMTHVEDGKTVFWDKSAYLERVRGREPFAGAASFGVSGIDVAGGEIARVHLWVDVPPLRYEDHLGFVKVDGAWKLLTKVFRTAGHASGGS